MHLQSGKTLVMAPTMLHTKTPPAAAQISYAHVVAKVPVLTLAEFLRRYQAANKMELRVRELPLSSKN